jgi:hypothetical protein
MKEFMMKMMMGISKNSDYIHAEYCLDEDDDKFNY